MADNKIKFFRILGILPFITITALALIISGLTLSGFPTEMSKTEQTFKQIFTIEYTHCEPFVINKPCEEEFTIENKEYCQCFVETNLTKNFYGNVVVHSQLELYNQQESRVDNSSVTTFTDIISNTSGQCDPYKTDKPMPNEMCETIPNVIFNDQFTLMKYNYSSKDDIEVGNFYKSERWSAYVNDDSTNGLQDKIIVLMNSKWDKENDMKGLTTGKYSLFLNFYPVNIQHYTVRRYAIFSVQNEEVLTTYWTTVLGIIALVVGLVLLALSFTLYAHRKRLQGIGTQTATVVTESPPTADSRLSRTQPEETPLSVPVNNGLSRTQPEETPLSVPVNNDA